MKNSEFYNKLKQASLKAIDRTNHFFKEKDINGFRYNVLLNVLDGDSAINQMKNGQNKMDILKLDLTDKQVGKLLEKDERFPENLRINVLKSTPRSTTFNLLCSVKYSGKNVKFHFSKTE